LKNFNKEIQAEIKQGLQSQAMTLVIILHCCWF